MHRFPFPILLTSARSDFRAGPEWWNRVRKQVLLLGILAKAQPTRQHRCTLLVAPTPLSATWVPPWKGTP